MLSNRVYTSTKRKFIENLDKGMGLRTNVSITPQPSPEATLLSCRSTTDGNRWLHNLKYLTSKSYTSDLSLQHLSQSIHSVHYSDL